VSLSFRELKHTHNLAIYWRSFELRPAGSPPMPVAYRARIEAARPRLLQTARDVYGVALKIGPFGINSRPALILDKYAVAQGQADGFHEAVMHAYWREGRDISDPDTLRALLVSAGLTAEVYEAALNDPAYREAVEADIAQAQAFGLTGVPASIFAAKYLISGAQPTEVFANVIEEVKRRLDADAAPHTAT
jgi:predicted DsbA family dithiol-disulfide isomerase